MRLQGLVARDSSLTGHLSFFFTYAFMIQEKITQTELKIREVCSKAQDKLTLLLDKLESSSRVRQESVSRYSVSSSINTQHASNDVSFELILGSVESTSACINSLTINEIISLTDVDTKQIQVYSHGVLIATGALLVINGKLAIRIEKTIKER